MLCEIISSCSNLYQIETDDLESAISKMKDTYFHFDFESINKKETISVALKPYEPRKRSKPSKKVDEAQAEVDFIQSMLYYVCKKQINWPKAPRSQ